MRGWMILAGRERNDYDQTSTCRYVQRAKMTTSISEMREQAKKTNTK